MISVRGLSKYYGEHAAIRELSFDIQRGEVIGFLGLNGAGKTTTLKILGCVLLPTSGEVLVDGLDVTERAHEVRKRVGFLPESPPLYPEMTVRGYLTFAARLRGCTGKDAAARVAEAEDKTALGEVDGEIIATLSHGYRQRVGLAQALVHRPALLILDEPTSGLDPVQIVEMRNLIRRLRGEHTLLISSHNLAEISQTCDRLLVIQAGEIVAQGSESDLAAAAGTGSDVEIEVGAAPERALAVLRAVPGVLGAEMAAGGSDGRSTGTALCVRCAGDLRAALVRAAVAAGLDVLRLDRSASRLESIFIQLARAGGERGESEGESGSPGATAVVPGPAAGVPGDGAPS